MQPLGTPELPGGADYVFGAQVSAGCRFIKGGKVLENLACTQGANVPFIRSKQNGEWVWLGHRPGLGGRVEVKRTAAEGAGVVQPGQALRTLHLPAMNDC